MNIMIASNDMPMSGVIREGSKEKEEDSVSLTTGPEINELEIKGWKIIEPLTGEKSCKRQQQAMNIPGGSCSHIPIVP